MLKEPKDITKFKSFQKMFSFLQDIVKMLHKVWDLKNTDYDSDKSVLKWEHEANYVANEAIGERMSMRV